MQRLLFYLWTQNTKRYLIYLPGLLSFVDGTETRTYNGFGQLTEITGPGGSASFAYRPDGLRYSKTTGSGNAAITHIHLWDGQNIVAEAGVSGVINTRYIRGVGLVAREMDSALQYYQFNAHGDVLHRIDASGNVLKNYRYDAFGNELDAEPLDVNPFRYCGEYFDRETGTYYLRARNYDPFTRRFTTEDPARAGLNWYAYCSNNPVSLFDPSGHLPEPPQKDPWALERDAVAKAYKQDWSGKYVGSDGYEGIEVTYDFKVMTMLYAQDLNIAPDDLMTLMATESKIATRWNSSGGAVGLIQFALNPYYGYSLNEISQMDALQQLALVHQTFKNQLAANPKADPSNIIDLYTLIFNSAGGGYGAGDDYMVMSMNNPYYQYNVGMDKDYPKNGISRGDMRKHMEEQMDSYFSNRR